MNAKLPFLFCSIFPIAAATACGGAVSPEGSALFGDPDSGYFGDPDTGSLFYPDAGHLGDPDTGTQFNPDGGVAIQPPTSACSRVPASDPGALAGNCSLVGTWSLSSSHGVISSTGVLQINADGSYYGGPAGTDLTKSFGYDGAYSVGGSSFQLLSSCGDGSCAGAGTFTVQFESGCAVATLDETTTQCTGNRTAVAGSVVLTRR